MSTVEIKLPRPPLSGVEIPAYFKQLELCVHHARKAYQVQIENAQGGREDDFIEYGTPDLDKTVAQIVSEAYTRNKEVDSQYYLIDTESDVKENLSEEHEDIVLRINVE